MAPSRKIDIDAIKAQIDAEIAARLLIEADAARYIQRRGFCIGELRLLVHLNATSEVLEMPPLFRLPGTPVAIKGLANRHGRVVPVMDLPVLFGTSLNRPKSLWLLVCGRGDEAVGLVIDSLPERKKFVQDDEVSLAQITHPIADYAKTAYRDGTKGAGHDVWIDLDTEKLFNAVFHVKPASV
ncbi:MAG: chemotaxis protein CheW [Gallionella sp.]